MVQAPNDRRAVVRNMRRRSAPDSAHGTRRCGGLAALVPASHAAYVEELGQHDRLILVLHRYEVESQSLLSALVPDVDVQHLKLVVFGGRGVRNGGETIGPLWRLPDASGVQSTMPVLFQFTRRCPKLTPV